MAKFSIQAGTTGQTINLFIQDSTSTAGAGLTGLTATGVTAFFAFARVAPVSITLVTTTVATGVFATGAFIQISSANMPGWYRCDIPNASLASANGNFVSMHFFGGTNMAPVPVEIELTVVNNQSSTFGLASTLPVDVRSWTGAATATTNVALATLAPANVVQWSIFSAATTQVAVATTPLSANVTQWAGAASATTNVALATLAPANVIQWAGFSAATTQAAIATTPLSANVTQWAGAATATTNTAIIAPPTNFTTFLISASGGVTTNTLATAAITSLWQYAADGTVTAEQSLRLANSANGGLLSGATTGAVAIRDLANTKNRILASTDAGGNLNTVTLDLT